MTMNRIFDRWNVVVESIISMYRYPFDILCYLHHTNEMI